MRRFVRRYSWLLSLATLLFCLMLLPQQAAGTIPPVADTPAGHPPAEAPLAPPEVLRKIDPTLLKQIVAAPDEVHRFLVHLSEKAALPPPETLAQVGRLARRQTVVRTLKDTAERAQAELSQFLTAEQAAGRVQQVKPYWVFNGMAVKGQGLSALQVARRDDVEAVRLDRVRYIIDTARPEDWTSPPGNSPSAAEAQWNIQKIRADQVWNALRIDGSGVVVANMDTGVDWTHPALLARYRGNMGKGLYDHVPNWFCATDEGYAVPTDGYGHGTHTMGTIVGQADGHPAIGVAPGARWMAVKIFDDTGAAMESWIHAGFQWILDPGGLGRPSLAPDVVSNSWGSEDGGDEAFRPDVRAWRAAGIVPVFAAGNSGPFEGSLGSPGSYPESIAVGATDRDDYIAYFSSRGPSPWEEIKPEVSAPGVDVVSSIPAGDYAAYRGTSMAAPHVTGLVALLLQANPLLSIGQVENLLTSTAVRRGSSVPNNTYGWGRVDAYGAVATATHPGHLTGTVRRSFDIAPVSTAYIQAQAFLPSSGSGQGLSGAKGQYDLALAPWTYDVTASAFGYQPTTAFGISIVTGTTATRDFTLYPLPTGKLEGWVTEAGTGQPLSATIIISGTPVTTTTVPSTGYYSVDLPAGTYTVQVQSRDHRVGWAYDLSVSAGETTGQNFTLDTAPTILLVDSGAWYGLSQARFFRAALDDLNYFYDLWTIHAVYGAERDVPQAADLAPYDIVIWSSPNDSPGYAEAWGALAAYLDGGGRLFLTGQDVGFWDRPSGEFASPEYGRYLRTRYVQDNAGSKEVTGLAGGLLEGLSLALQGGDGADNQDSPDEIAVTDEALATPLAQYATAGLAAQEASKCSPYRAVYFAFGFEAIDQRATRREVMDRLLNWLVAPSAAVSEQLTPAWQTGIQPSGQSITYTVQVHNTSLSGEEDLYHLALDGATWPAVLTSDTVTVAACGIATVTVRVDVPSGLPWKVSDALTVSSQSTLSPTLRATAVISTAIPAPILLVDGDRWYNMEADYKTALAQNGLPFDYWNVGWNPGEGQGNPSADTLRMYPMIVWFTGYDWFDPLPSQSAQALQASLDSGSRLFLTSQDYLFVRGMNAFGQNYLGIGSFTEGLTTTQAIGLRGNPLGTALGPYPLAYPYPNRSDAVTPAQAGDAAFEGSQGLPVGLTHSGTGFRTSFWAFPFEAISPEASRREAMQAAVGWLSWLGASTFTADRTLVGAGATIAYTLTVRSDGWQPVSAVIANDLPETLSIVPGSLAPPEATYHADTRTITWSGNLPPGDALPITYLAVVSDTISGATPVTNVVHLRYAEHSVQFDRASILDVNAPDLSASSMTVDKASAQPGDVLTYTIVLRNDGLAIASAVTLSNPLPVQTTYVTGSLQLEGGGVADDANGIIGWNGSLDVGARVTLTYRCKVTTLERGIWVRNVAHLKDGYSLPRVLQATTYIHYTHQWLPLLLRRHAG